MTLADIAGLFVVLLFFALMLAYLTIGRRWAYTLRHIPGFGSLGMAIERAVEAGERVHLSLGTGSILRHDAGAAFVGLAMLRRIAEATTMSDRPAVVTSADGATTLLAQDTLQASYRRMGAADRYHPTSARMLGPSPLSYIAGIPTLLATEDVSVQVMNGTFAQEGALAADFGERREAFVIAGAHDVPTQALLYAVAQNPLIGEEVFAGGAYLNVGGMHRASLRAQDVFRMILIGAIIVGTILRTIGIGL
jgi:hypothetical protein